MLELRALGLDGVCEVRPRRWSDERGFFAEIYSAKKFEEVGLPTAWVQDNHSLSRQAGTVRGLHFQRPPVAQAKLVSVLVGSVFDVAVDLRQRSPTRGRWIGVTLTAEDGNQLFVPPGFAHGFMTLCDDCEVLYKVDAPYCPEHEVAIRYDDPDLAIEWPKLGEITLSEKDREARALVDIVTGF